MFGSNKKKESTARNIAAPGMPQTNGLNSLVAGTSVEGNISSKSDIRIDGSISGTLKCEAKVIIGPTGKIDGEVFCQNAVIEGKFNGTLHVKDLLNIRESAHVEGNIRYSKLVVQMGAALIGDVRLNSTSGGNSNSNSKAKTIVEARPNGKTAKAEAAR
ncbi:MAG: cytoskeletal protein CcmA (bactofilin family) [Saprospiraceae bacterium]|jgi:cytoskeletal protein CcmA (bactofilin family)